MSFHGDGYFYSRAALLFRSDFCFAGAAASSPHHTSISDVSQRVPHSTTVCDRGWSDREEARPLCCCLCCTHCGRCSPNHSEERSEKGGAEMQRQRRQTATDAESTIVKTPCSPPHALVPAVWSLTFRSLCVLLLCCCACFSSSTFFAFSSPSLLSLLSLFRHD